MDSDHHLRAWQWGLTPAEPAKNRPSCPPDCWQPVSSAAPALWTHSLASGPSPSRPLHGKPEVGAARSAERSRGGPAPLADTPETCTSSVQGFPTCGCCFPVRGHLHDQPSFNTLRKGRQSSLRCCCLLISPWEEAMLPFPARRGSRWAEAMR